MDNKTKKQLIIAQGYAIIKKENLMFKTFPDQNNTTEWEIKLRRRHGGYGYVSLDDIKDPKKPLTIEQLLEDGFGQLKSKKECLIIFRQQNRYSWIRKEREQFYGKIIETKVKERFYNDSFHILSEDRYYWPIECFKK